MADMCECICSFQWAMRRLAQIINQAQTYCTEDECNPGDQQVVIIFINVNMKIYYLNNILYT